MAKNSTKKEVDAWAAAQLGEKIKQAPREQRELLAHSGMLPDDVIDAMVTYSQNYDYEWQKKHSNLSKEKIPVHPENTKWFKQTLERNLSKKINKAVTEGNDRVINRFNGIVSQETGISQIQSHLRFVNWVTRTAGITYLAGHMGSGKTDFSALMLETFYEALKDSDNGVEIATNVKSLAENHKWIKFIPSQTDLVEWLESNDAYKLFLFDEGSSHASGYSEDSSKVTQQMRSVLNLIRKNNGNMIFVGHSGKDIHPHVRRLADFVQKESKKDAIVFNDVNEAEGVNKKFKLSEIPETSLSFNTKESSTWNWADGGQEYELLRIAYKCWNNSDMSQKETAENFPDISGTQIGWYSSVKA